MSDFAAEPSEIIIGVPTLRSSPPSCSLTGTKKKQYYLTKILILLEYTYQHLVCLQRVLFLEK